MTRERWFRIGLAALGAGVILVMARDVSAVADVESHCVVDVIGHRSSGELVLSDARCYGTFAEARTDASQATIGSVGGGAMRLEAGEETLSGSSFTLGIHFDGFNGTGSSITVVGDTCGGGWWNPGSTWANRISSSYNGCQRLRHYDFPNKSGAWEDTYASGTTDNLSPLNNKTESVAYYSS